MPDVPDLAHIRLPVCDAAGMATPEVRWCLVCLAVRRLLAGGTAWQTEFWIRVVNHEFHATINHDPR